MKKKIGIVIVLFACAGLLRHFYPRLEKFSAQLPAAIQNFASSTVATQIQNKIAQEVFAPPPLISNQPNSGGAVLTNSGVISWTNINRKQNGNLVALKENAKLDLAAQNKINDMFKQQYFEHVNPQGKGPADLDNAVGYAYVSVGENLAEGYFKNDEDLLTARMNSPGHRANILNSKFMEIGAAVGQGMYQGQKVWMAVQEFGRPASSCPTVDISLKAQIAQLQEDINQIQPQLSALQSQINSSNPQSQADYDSYNAKVADYNNLVKIFNNKLDSLKLVTSQYNAEVNAYNGCLAS